MEKDIKQTWSHNDFISMRETNAKRDNDGTMMFVIVKVLVVVMVMVRQRGGEVGCTKSTFSR